MTAPTSPAARPIELKPPVVTEPPVSMVSVPALVWKLPVPVLTVPVMIRLPGPVFRSVPATLVAEDVIAPAKVAPAVLSICSVVAAVTVTALV